MTPIKSKDGKVYRLTIKQEGFCQDIVKGLPQCDAYRNNYSTDNMGDNAVYVESCKMRKIPKIAHRIQELMDENAKEYHIDMDKLVRWQHKAIDFALQDGNSQAMSRAVETMGKLTGNWVDKSEVKHEGESPEEWLQEYMSSRDTRDKVNH